MSLKDRKRSEVLYSLLGVRSVADVVRRSRLRWFGHVERKNEDDWVLASISSLISSWLASAIGRASGQKLSRLPMNG